MALTQQNECSYCLSESVSISGIDIGLGASELRHALGGVVLVHGLGSSGSNTDMVAGIFLRLSSSDGTSEEILVFLVGEVHVIVSVGVRELSRVVSVILPGSLGTEGLSMSPGLQLQVRDGSVSVVITDLHGTSVCLVIDNFSSKHVLLLFTETLKDVFGAYFHNADFVVEADLGVSRVLGRAHLELADLSVTTSGDEVRYKSHVLGVLHVRLSHRTGFVSESFVLSVGVPIVMGLVVPMVLLE